MDHGVLGRAELGNQVPDVGVLPTRAGSIDVAHRSPKGSPKGRWIGPPNPGDRSPVELYPDGTQECQRPQLHRWVAHGQVARAVVAEALGQSVDQAGEVRRRAISSHWPMRRLVKVRLTTRRTMVWSGGSPATKGLGAADGIEAQHPRFTPIRRRNQLRRVT